jgi:ankyrin repeat protein
MRNWDDYKNTFKTSEDVFMLARGGDVLKLKAFLDSNPETPINQKNHKGYSPLMISVYNGNHETSELLLERGADPNSSDLSGNTILMGAAFKGDAEMIKLLIQRGAQKCLKNHKGLTAEEWASAFGRREVLSILKPEANYSRFVNFINAIKIIWGFMKPNSRKEVTV